MNGLDTLAGMTLAHEERAAAQGAQLGLTGAQINEVVTAWADWFAVRPYAFNWNRVDQAMTSRAMGERWQP